MSVSNAYLFLFTRILLNPAHAQAQCERRPHSAGLLVVSHVEVKARQAVARFPSPARVTHELAAAGDPAGYVVLSGDEYRLPMASYGDAQKTAHTHALLCKS